MSIEPRQDRRFGVRSYCVRAERQVTLRLWSAAALVSLHKFFSCLKQFGYPSLAADYTLALSSLMDAVVKLHEKRPALPEKLKELQTKGRKLTQRSNIKHQKSMHDTIYQISTKSIANPDYLNIDNIVAGEMASIDYIYENTEEGRSFDLKRLIEDILPKGMFTLNADNTLTYNGGFSEWRKTYLELIRTKMADINIGNVMQWVGPTYQLQKAIVNPLETGSLFVMDFYNGGGTAERSADLMRMVGDMKKGEKLHIGAIYGYHF